MAEVSKVKAGDNLKNSIKKAVDDLGGFSKFIKKGDVVMLRPNFNTADPYPASTDLAFLKPVVELVYEAEAKLVMIGCSSTMTLNTRKVLEKAGVFELHNMEQPPRIMAFEEKEWVKKTIPDAKYLKKVSVPKILERMDKLILLPCLKTHFQAQFTGSLKLSVAFMKPVQRVPLHLTHIQEKIAELNKIINPDLIIMDARKCFINEGPSQGDVAEPGLIMASLSRVAIDVEGVKIIQGYKGNSLKDIDPYNLPQIKRAIEIGIR
jgi:uncharacterized protein (DUF362 family)